MVKSKLDYSSLSTRRATSFSNTSIGLASSFVSRRPPHRVKRDYEKWFASDLDLALMTDEPLSIARTAELKAAFTKSDLPSRVDLVDWASTSQSFREGI